MVNNKVHYFWILSESPLFSVPVKIFCQMYEYFTFLVFSVRIDYGVIEIIYSSIDTVARSKLILNSDAVR